MPLLYAKEQKIPTLLYTGLENMMDESLLRNSYLEAHSLQECFCGERS